MNKIILADSQAIFRTGTAKVLAMNEEVRIIAQCTDLDRMQHAITTFPGSIVLFAASLRPDMDQLHTLLESTGSRGIVIAENNENAAAYLHQGFRGVVFRSVTGPALAELFRLCDGGFRDGALLLKGAQDALRAVEALISEGCYRPPHRHGCVLLNALASHDSTHSPPISRGPGDLRPRARHREGEGRTSRRADWFARLMAVARPPP